MTVINQTVMTMPSMPISDEVLFVGLGRPTKTSRRVVVIVIAIDLHESLLGIRDIIVKIYPPHERSKWPG